MKPWVLALLGIVIAIAATAADAVLLSVPAVRNGYWTLIPLTLAFILAGVAVARHRSWTTIVPAFIVLLAGGIHGFSRWMPAPTESPIIHVGDLFPDAVLPDQEGHTMRLSEVWARGPLVIVLFRGSW